MSASRRSLCLAAVLLLPLALAGAAEATEGTAAPGRYVRIGHYQCVCRQRDFEANLEKLHEGLKLAAEARLDIVSFPESFLTGYFAREEDARANAFSIDSSQMKRVLKETAGYGITFLVGFNELRGDELYNTVVVIERGRLLGRYSKAMPIHRYFTPGREFPVFETRGLKFGVVICADGGYIEPARILALKGARLIFAPHFNFVRDPLEHYQNVRSDHVARAVENGVYFLRGNNVVPERELEGLRDFGWGYGDSYLIDPNGQTVAAAGLYQEYLMVYNFDLQKQHRNKPNRRSAKSAVELLDQLKETLEAYAEEKVTATKFGMYGQSYSARYSLCYPDLVAVTFFLPAGVAMKHLSAAAAAWLLVTAVGLSAEQSDDSGDELAPRVTSLCRQYVAGFGSKATQVVYHHRLDGPRGIAALAAPAEIAAGTVRGQPLPYGYGSGIQDVALENGQLLFALCEAQEATGDAELAEMARWVFEGLTRAATLSPEPGFVPRGPHPDGKSYYRDSSRDQHAAMAEALWRFGRSPLASEADRRLIRRELAEMAQRMERNGWRILVEDGSRTAHVGWGWTQMTSIGAISLLSFLSLVADATDEPHWRQLYADFSAEEDGRRWHALLSPAAADDWRPLTLYSNQFAQALVVLKRTEADLRRREQIAELLRRLAERALDSNVFDPVYWRRLDWAGDSPDAEIERRLAPLGLSLARPATVADLFAAFDPACWRPGNRGDSSTAAKLCFGIPTAAFHKVMLSEDDQLTGRIAPSVRRMVDVMHEHGDEYEAGENFNRAAVLGLLLVAREARKRDGGNNGR